MPETQDIVINTSPIIALVAALGDLSVLQRYRQVWIPLEVGEELVAGGAASFALAEYQAADWLHKRTEPLTIAPHLLNTLDKGEASVIQLALDKSILTVVIDETAGRRIARLNGLAVTGTIGILLRAKSEGRAFSMRKAIERMQAHGVWLSKRVIAFALTQAGEAR